MNPIRELFEIFYSKYKICKHKGKTDKESIFESMEEVWDWHNSNRKMFAKSILEENNMLTKRLFKLEKEVTRLKTELKVVENQMDYPIY